MWLLGAEPPVPAKLAQPWAGSSFWLPARYRLREGAKSGGATTSCMYDRL